MKRLGKRVTSIAQGHEAPGIPHHPSVTGASLCNKNVCWPREALEYRIRYEDLPGEDDVDLGEPPTKKKKVK